MKNLILLFLILSCTQSFAKESSDDIQDYFQNKLKAVREIQKDLIDFSEDIPQYDRLTYNSVYEVSSVIACDFRLILSYTYLDDFINPKFKEDYINYIMFEIKSMVKSFKLNIKRLDQLSASMIKHPGLQRAIKNLTDICLDIKNKYA